MTGWSIDHSRAALAEGWDLFDCGDVAHGPWQVQRDDEADILPDDPAAWLIAKRQDTPHSRAVMAFLWDHNQAEYDRIMRWAA